VPKGFVFARKDVVVVENGRIDMLYRLVEQMREETNHRFDRLEARLDRRLDNHGDRIAELEQQHAHLEGKVKAWSGLIAAGVSAAWQLLSGRWGQQ